MSERTSDRQSSNEVKIIKGTSLAIHFDTYPELLARVEDRDDKYLSYLSIDKEGDLPFPITQFNLSSYWRYENTDIPDISGTVSFAAEDTSEAPNAWPYSILDTIRERLAIGGSYPQQINYDPLALYIPVDEIRLLRLEFYSGPNECGIEISTIYKEDSHLVLETHGVTKTNSADAVLQAGEILTILADELCKTYDTQDLEPQRLDPYVLDASLKYLDENGQQNPDASNVDYSMEAAATPAATLALGERALTYRYPNTGPSPEELELKQRLTLQQIGGFFKTKERLEQLANVFDNAEIAARYGVTANNFMLHGPSKVDNDQLIEAFAGSINAVVIPLRTTDLVDKMIGESAKKLEKIFRTAIESDERQVIHFETIDLLLRSGPTSSSVYEEISATLSHYLRETRDMYPHIIIVASTTQDTDFMPRELSDGSGFELIDAPLPSERERVDMWAALLDAKRAEFDSEWVEGAYQDGTLNPIRNDYDYAVLAKISNRLHGEHLRNALSAALFESYQLHVQTGEMQQVTQEQLEQAIKKLALQ